MRLEAEDFEGIRVRLEADMTEEGSEETVEIVEGEEDLWEVLCLGLNGGISGILSDFFDLDEREGGGGGGEAF